jgi:hypothetical protein
VSAWREIVMNNEPDDFSTSIDAAGGTTPATTLPQDSASASPTLDDEAHATSAAALGQIPEKFRRTIATVVSPEIHFDSAQAQLDQDATSHFGLAGIGTAVGEQYVSPVRRAAIDRAADAYGVDREDAQRFTDQMAGARAMQDVREVLRNQAIDPDRARTLQKLGLLQQTLETNGRTRLRVTNDALPLLLRTLRHAAKVRPDVLAAPPVPGPPGQALDALVEAGQLRLARAGSTAASQAEPGDGSLTGLSQLKGAAAGELPQPAGSSEGATRSPQPDFEALPRPWGTAGRASSTQSSAATDPADLDEISLSSATPNSAGGPDGPTPGDMLLAQAPRPGAQNSKPARPTVTPRPARTYADPHARGLTPKEAEDYYQKFAADRRAIYEANKVFLDSHLFTTKRGGPEAVDLRTHKPLEPEAERLWSQIFLDDGAGKNGKTSQLGECASLPINLAGIPSDTDQWRPGKCVLDMDSIAPGTAIATFDEKGRYTGKHDGHCAIVISKTKDSIKILDQYNPGYSGRSPQVRDLPRWRPGDPMEGRRSNSANWFYVIQTK